MLKADSSQLSEPQKSPSDESEGPIPCKKKRSHFRESNLQHSRSGNTSDGKSYFISCSRALKIYHKFIFISYISRKFKSRRR